MDSLNISNIIVASKLTRTLSLSLFLCKTNIACCQTHTANRNYIFSFVILLFCLLRRISRGISYYFRWKKKKNLLSVVAKWTTFRAHDLVCRVTTWYCSNFPHIKRGCNFLQCHIGQESTQKNGQTEREQSWWIRRRFVSDARVHEILDVENTLLFVRGKFTFTEKLRPSCVIASHSALLYVLTWRKSCSSPFSHERFISPIPPLSLSPCNSWCHVWHTFVNANPVIVRSTWISSVFMHPE